jgi:RNA polymerase sigma-70 factor (ECF subfamily)
MMFPVHESYAGGPAGGGAFLPDKKIIQRIQAAAVSHSAERTLMADADADLVCQSRNGDPLAFEELVRRHQKMIHALTFRMTGSPADAEDLAQETFIRAFAQIGSFQGGAKFSTWLCSIAVHGCLNWRRDEARRNHAHAGCVEAMLVEKDGAGDGEAGGGAEMARQTQAALLRLPAKQRAAVVLTIHEGLNHAEAAKILRCSETTVSWRVFAAKRKLKNWLSKKGGGHE